MNVAELPEHVATSGTWKQWPRKLDAHLSFGVRQRQISAYIRNGEIKVYRCPDETLRLDADKLREMFGEPDQIQGRDRDLSAAARRRKQAELEAPDDPMAYMFGRVTAMIGDLHAQQISQLKGISEPLTALLGGYKDALIARDARIQSLETQLDEQSVLRVELDEIRRETELRRERERASERRRDETLQLLKEQLPSLASAWLAGDTLSGFAKRTPREVIESIIESGALNEQDSELLRRGAGIPRPSAPVTPSQVNGVNHGSA